MENEFACLRKKKLTQASLAEKMYVPISTIRNWEHGLSIPSIDDMRKLAKILEVDENVIVSSFQPQKTIVSTKAAKEDEMYDILLKLFWNCESTEHFIKLVYLFSLKQTSGVICYCNYVFPFTKVVASQNHSAILLTDSSDNYVVFTKMNIIEVEPISVNYDVFTFDIVTDCPIFPIDSKYSSDSFKQKIRLSFFYR